MDCCRFAINLAQTARFGNNTSSQKTPTRGFRRMICGLNCPEGSFYDIFSHKIPPYSKYTFFYLKRVEGVLHQGLFRCYLKFFKQSSPAGAGLDWSEGDASPFIQRRIFTQTIQRFRQPRKNTSSEKFERDRVTNLHEASQPNFLEGFFRGCPQFNLESSPLMQRIVELKENSYADAIDSYNRVLEVAGDITANTVFPNSDCEPKATRLNESCWREWGDIVRSFMRKSRTVV